MNCDECKKDWTKCATCSVTMQWVRERINKNRRKGEIAFDAIDEAKTIIKADKTESEE